MQTLIAVFRKEVLDNVRDRRTLASALIMGPLFGPLLFAFVINLSIERSLDDLERVTELPVIGQEHAPNLLRYLESHNIEITAGPVDRDTALDAVGTGVHDVVLIIPEDFGDQFADSVPARVELVTDQANSQAEREARRVRTALHAYSQELAAIRLSARGVSPLALRPLNVDEVDVSTPSGRSAILLGMMSYFFIFALLMGGMYLAIDTTAGERERGSLEPLLALPVTRDQLMLGKIAAKQNKHKEAVLRLIPKATYETADTEIEGAMRVLEGTADAFVYDYPFNAVFRALNPSNQLAFLDEPFTKEPIAWAIRKNDPDFMKFLNDFLLRMKADGRFDRIYHKWFLSMDWYRFAR